MPRSNRRADPRQGNSSQAREDRGIAPPVEGRRSASPRSQPRTDSDDWEHINERPGCVDHASHTQPSPPMPPQASPALERYRVSHETPHVWLLAEAEHEENLAPFRYSEEPENDGASTVSETRTITLQIRSGGRGRGPTRSPAFRGRGRNRDLGRDSAHQHGDFIAELGVHRPVHDGPAGPVSPSATVTALRGTSYSESPDASRHSTTSDYDFIIDPIMVVSDTAGAGEWAEVVERHEGALSPASSRHSTLQVPPSTSDHIRKDVEDDEDSDKADG